MKLHNIGLLLELLLPIGLGALACMIISVLVGRAMIRRNRDRLLFAIRENNNLSQQWESLVGTQKELFLKLKTRWEADRKAWEEQVQNKEARIAELEAAAKSGDRINLGDTVAEGELKKRISELQDELQVKVSDIEELRAQIKERSEASETEATEQQAGEDTELRLRIRDLEQDLVDAHDELHDVRENYLKQSDVVENLEKRLVDAGGSESKSGGGEIEGVRKELDLFRQEVDTLRLDTQRAQSQVGQLETLLSIRSRSLGRAKKQTETQETQAATLKEKITGLEEKVDKLSAEKSSLSDEVKAAEKAGREAITKKEADFDKELKTVVDHATSRASEDVQQIKSLEKEVAELSSKLDERKVELESGVEKIAKLTGELSTLEASHAALREETKKVEHRRDRLSASVDDVSHELYDVRTAYMARLKENDELNEKLDQLAEVEKQKSEVSSDLSKANVRLDQASLALTVKTKEFNEKSGLVEELEAVLSIATMRSISSVKRSVRRQKRLGLSDPH